MIITKQIGTDNLAKVYIGQIEGRKFEFAESLQPPLQLNEKWVLIISCLYGCPVKCIMCDAGRRYDGCMSKEDIFSQIDYLIARRFPDKHVPVKKFKIQFTRMGEPAFNPAVLEVLEELPVRYTAPGLIPSISTIGPKNCSGFFSRLREIKNKLYRNGKFQMQFSVHSTDLEKRDKLIPVQKMSFKDIADYGKEFYVQGDRKITLNFIVMKDYPINPKIISTFFDKDIFLIKLTPLNPTKNAEKNKLETKLDPYDENSVAQLTRSFRSLGFETIVSIGELEENKIGSNCWQYISSDKNISSVTTTGVFNL